MLNVLENPDLRIQITSYAGINVEKRCWLCNNPIKYNNFLESHNYIYKKIFDYFLCKNVYICDDMCFLIYNTHFKYNRGILFFILTITLIFILSLLFLFWISRLGL